MSRTAIAVLACLGLGVGWVGAQAPRTNANPDGPVLPSSITYTQIYASADGETHFREVTIPLTPVQSAPPAPPLAQSALSPATESRWAVFPKGWGVDDYRKGIYHNVSAKRFVSIREGTFVIKASDGEERKFKKGDIFEALDVAPSKGQLDYSEDGMVALLTNHP
jgi:hypothetical protein